MRKGQLTIGERYEARYKTTVGVEVLSIDAGDPGIRTRVFHTDNEQLTAIGEEILLSGGQIERTWAEAAAEREQRAIEKERVASLNGRAKSLGLDITFSTGWQHRLQHRVESETLIEILGRLERAEADQQAPAAGSALEALLVR